MKETVKGSLFILELNEIDSSFITQIVYNAKTDVMSVVLKNENVYNYEKVPMQVFVEFSSASSPGEYYNTNIKNKFKHKKLTTMANGAKGNQPNRINKAGDFKRYIKMSIDVTKLKKDWFYTSKDDDGNIKAVYAKITLCMLPDGEVDKYGSLGFIVQDIPQEVSKAEKDLPKDKKSRGAIIGNGEELEWVKEEEKVTVINENDMDELDDLPF